MRLLEEFIIVKLISDFRENVEKTNRVIKKLK